MPTVRRFKMQMLFVARYIATVGFVRVFILSRASHAWCAESIALVFHFTIALFLGGACHFFFFCHGLGCFFFFMAWDALFGFFAWDVVFFFFL